jgi:MFS transporter, DHA1 family, tetracycline resistance protein|tara:strand:- start:262 stop:696 length:435 start_codon:yes stop_codon:yes gene_type:complete|eukprot:31457-Pelagococcus_subviridis.AAC.23
MNFLRTARHRPQTIGLTLTTAVGLALVSAGLFALSFAGGAGPVAAVCAATLYVAGIPLFTPAVPILLMQCVPKNKRGAVMGIDSAVNSVARILTPVLLGRYYSGDVGACFFAAGCVVATATVLVIARRVMVMGTGGWFANGSAR